MSRDMNDIEEEAMQRSGVNKMASQAREKTGECGELEAK